MRVMLDANVHISIALFSTPNMSALLKDIQNNHILVLSDCVLKEVLDTANRKFPNRLVEMNTYINNLQYEYFNSNYDDPTIYPTIRDYKNVPIFASAIQAQVDLFITGDKDFDEVRMDRPRILKPRQYHDEFMK